MTSRLKDLVFSKLSAAPSTQAYQHNATFVYLNLALFEVALELYTEGLERDKNFIQLLAAIDYLPEQVATILQQTINNNGKDLTANFAALSESVHSSSFSQHASASAMASEIEDLDTSFPDTNSDIDSTLTISASLPESTKEPPQKLPPVIKKFLLLIGIKFTKNKLEKLANHSYLQEDTRPIFEATLQHYPGHIVFSAIVESLNLLAFVAEELNNNMDNGIRQKLDFSFRCIGLPLVLMMFMANLMIFVCGLFVVWVLEGLAFYVYLRILHTFAVIIWISVRFFAWRRIMKDTLALWGKTRSLY
ncbi:hypothetical protein G7Y89_g7108 [Cudoniella acicularis]|uniref:Uncharacterized protein n=1 Tax=Cudoniella acicularis TaxID=354080 RepID=A0A8H4RJ48_9HELO|nr:hypothetical protein G7Y89_g7108 [Cudoniella acicularis]